MTLITWENFRTTTRSTTYKSKSPVAALITRLRLLGFLQSTAEKRLKPGVRFFERPLFDSVRAGMPSPADDTCSESVIIDQYLVNHPSHTILVTVKGESMTGEGIMPGDTVILEKRHMAEVGELVIAIVDNEFTLKRLGKDKGGFVLHPANPEFPTLRPQGNLEIFGIVVGQFRKYK